jgi:hypothetical protein
MTPAKIDDKLERIVASLHHVKVSVDDAGAAALSVAVELANCSTSFALVWQHRHPYHDFSGAHHDAAK